jgi:hypothetical protein
VAECDRVEYIRYFPVSFHYKRASLCHVGIYFMDIALGVMITMLVRKCTISCIGVTDCWVEIKSENSSAFVGTEVLQQHRGERSMFISRRHGHLKI